MQYTESVECNTERGHHRMQNSNLYNMGINSYNFWSSDVCSSTLKNTTAVQEMHAL